ncbi:MAG: ECF transporter S component [Kineosporiaceae bacterium]
MVTDSDTSGSGSDASSGGSDVETPTPHRRRSWRTVDIVSAAVLGVAGGVLLVAANTLYGPVTAGPVALYPPLEGILTGLYVLPAVLGGLVIRKPGAALLTMVVAAVTSMLVGNQWGFVTLWYGLAQGAGAEIAFAALGYRRWGPGAGVLAALAAALGEAVLTVPLFYAGVGVDQQAARVGVGIASAVLLAGIGAWALTRALAGTGALDALASGRAARRV